MTVSVLCDLVGPTMVKAVGAELRAWADSLLVIDRPLFVFVFFLLFLFIAFPLLFPLSLPPSLLTPSLSQNVTA